MKGVNEPDDDDIFPANILPYDEVEEPVSADGFARYMLALARKELDTLVVFGSPSQALQIATWSRLQIAAQRVVDGLRVPTLIHGGEAGRDVDIEFVCPNPTCHTTGVTLLTARGPLAVHYRGRAQEGLPVSRSQVTRACLGCAPPSDGQPMLCCRCRRPLLVLEIHAIPRSHGRVRA